MDAARALVAEVLLASTYAAAKGEQGPFRWQIQGLGFLRLNLGTRYRIHVWDSGVRDPAASDMHDHRWPLRSTVLCGRVEQRRYLPPDPGEDGERFFMQTFGDEGEVEPGRWVVLAPGPLERYSAGETYEQTTDEIHRSFPIDGTVTIVEHVPGPNAALGHIFWPDDRTMHDGARLASPAEVLAITGRALDELGVDKEAWRCL